MTPFVGNIIGLFFVVCPVASLTQDSAYRFTAITNFALLVLTLSNCVGGQSLPSALALYYINQFHSRSSYTSETSIGANLAGTVVNNSGNVYAWSFSSSLPEVLQHDLLLGHRKLLGNEQLQITFTSALSAGVQIDVWAFCESLFEQRSNYVKAMAL